jgi:exonuclease III
MKIVTWNCNTNLKADFSVLDRFNADILFVQECEKMPRDCFDGFDFHWVGQNLKKGLGIFTRGPSKFPQEIYRSDFIYFIPVLYKDWFVLGAWAFNGRAQKFGTESSGYFLDVLDHYSKYIRSWDKVVVAGDFNNGPQWDSPGHRNNFADIDHSLNELGLYSAYHVSNSEEFGKETYPTYYHQRNPEKPFHIDYIYSNMKPLNPVTVGTFSDWASLSDHVPVTVEFE